MVKILGDWCTVYVQLCVSQIFFFLFFFYWFHLYYYIHWVYFLNAAELGCCPLAGQPWLPTASGSLVLLPLWLWELHPRPLFSLCSIGRKVVIEITEFTVLLMAQQSLRTMILINWILFFFSMAITNFQSWDMSKNFALYCWFID